MLKSQMSDLKVVVELVLKIKSSFQGFETERNLGFQKFVEI